MRRLKADLPLLVAIAALGVVLLFSAFQSDDAFITFRTVHNVWHGRGLTWNPAERVQAYTHPAWLLLALLCFGVSGECYFSVLVLAMLLALATALLLAKRASVPPFAAAALVTLLACSQAVVIYAVSGLENPLLFLLLVSFVLCLRREHDAPVWLASLLAALIALTRQDAIALIGPAYLLLMLRRMREPHALRSALCALAPLWLWELFSLIYYGSFVPNTALAKLNVALPVLALARQGSLYFLDSLITDPITLLVTLVACLLLLLRGAALDRAFALGIGLYFVYLLRIGGDFMSGRFFGAPLVLALACAVSAPGFVCSARLQKLALAVCLLYGVLWPRSPFHFDLAYGVGRTYADNVRDTGIADERGYYYPTTGLLRVLLGLDAIREAGLVVPPARGALLGREFAHSSAPLTVQGEVGFFGYFAGDKHVVDAWALTDPFLARLPFRSESGKFRVGHYQRAIPPGYLDSLVRGENLLVDPKLAHLYGLVQHVVRGPLFTRARWSAIAELHGL
jgi:arabinofuranosyltransferase